MENGFTQTINLVHYLLTKQRFAVGDGLKDLRHLLWYIDASAVRELGQPISAFRYRLGPDGPVPDHFSWAIGRLQAGGALGGGGADYLAYATASLNPIRMADISAFTEDAMDLIDRCYAVVSAAGYGGGRFAADHPVEQSLGRAKPDQWFTP